MKNVTFKYITVFLLSLCCTLSASAQDISTYSEMKDTLEREIELINRQLSNNKTQQKNDLNSLALTQKKIKNRKLLISKMDARISLLKENITAKTVQIQKLDKRLDTLTRHYENLVYNAYKNRDTKIWFMYLLASENIPQAVRRWQYFKNISSALKVQAEEITSTRTSLDKERKMFDEMARTADAEQKLRQEEFDRLSSEETALTKSLQKLSSQETKIKKQLSAKRKEMERINREIEALIAKAVKAQQQATDETSSEDFTNLTEKFASRKGLLPHPVINGVIVEPYGQSNHPVFKNVKLPFNNGINISTDNGAAAVSVFSGIVKHITVIPGYNQCVLVQHGQYYTFYCKLKKTSVKAGQKVSQGQEIGIIETTPEGNTILHFELWNGMTKQNPELWLKK
ncbi:MAG: peptidoglycan DD-metalloendopeptidase family protein [Alistipes sp.]|nr:peptidoglycan DD-metalloendopeptidase family protein [Candidatus Minthomonas equi]